MIPASRTIDDVSVSRLTVAERPAQRSDVNRQVPFHHEGVRPYRGHELALADQLARAFGERDQDLQRPAALRCSKADWRRATKVIDAVSVVMCLTK